MPEIEVVRLSLEMFLIVCPLVFLAGFLDALAGGGALLSIPAYLLAGVPVHSAIATNKLSASFGAVTSAACFIKQGLANFKIGIPSVVCAIAGSTLGAKLSLLAHEKVLTGVLFVALPLATWAVLNKNAFQEKGDEELVVGPRLLGIVTLVAFVMGTYDGFFGAGSGTFTLICFTLFAHMSMLKANAQMKLINCAATLSALVVFLQSGQVLVWLGLAAGACNMVGSLLGSRLAIEKGSKLIKPAILVVLTLLVVKLLGVY